MARSLFERKGVHCIVDGQFGSTGKGALSAWLAEQYMSVRFNMQMAGAIYSGGPNSGHTCYFGDRKVVLKQLPTFSAYLSLYGIRMPAYLSAGAVIDREILKKEAEEFDNIPIYVHPNAAIITDEDKRAEEKGSIAEVAGTRSGTGAALARKISREPKAIARESLGNLRPNVVLQAHRIKPEENPYFMEVSQGFSLGINSEFYPKVTSRECTVMQGLADARLPPSSLVRTYMAVRTFPIRVGNVDGYSSGDWYIDQDETSWEMIGPDGVPPERTTVTNRIRRVATFSVNQFFEACHANYPDFVFISHLDYLAHDEQYEFIDMIKEAGDQLPKGFDLIVGDGPFVSNIRRIETRNAD